MNGIIIFEDGKVEQFGSGITNVSNMLTTLLQVAIQLRQAEINPPKEENGEVSESND